MLLGVKEKKKIKKFRFLDQFLSCHAVDRCLYILFIVKYEIKVKKLRSLWS